MYSLTTEGLVESNTEALKLLVQALGLVNANIGAILHGEVDESNYQALELTDGMLAALQLYTEGQ